MECVGSCGRRRVAVRLCITHTRTGTHMYTHTHARICTHLDLLLLPLGVLEVGPLRGVAAHVPLEDLKVGFGMGWDWRG